MNPKIQTILVLAVLLSIQNFAQISPDYPERFLQDTLGYAGMMRTPVTATDGIIIPEEYKVGPGDKLFISISGVREIASNYLIDQEGWLYIPRVGGIDLRNKSLKEAKELINESILKYYKNVDIFISLVDFRMIKVSLVGNILKPNVFTLPSNSRLMDLVTGSKQLTETSDIRNIKVQTKNGELKEYDLISFLRNGDYLNNPILLEGDVIMIGRVDKIVQISGQVQFPAIYEFRPNESVADLIKLAGGFLYNARKDTIELVRFLDDGKIQISKYFSYDDVKENPIVLQNKDHVIVRQIPEYYIEHYVQVNGYVRFPGFYKIEKNVTSLFEIINKAGGFLEEASLTEASLSRTMDVDELDPEFERLKLIPTDIMTEDEYDYYKSKSRQRTGIVVVDFVKLFEQNDLREDVTLRKNDIISVPEKKDYIIMLGQFVNPGKIIYDSTLSVNDYIDLAGGFGWRALEGDVRIIRTKTGEWVDADEKVALKPGDTIWVPEDPPGQKFWDVFTDVLTIVAQLAAIVAASAAVIVATR